MTADKAMELLEGGLANGVFVTAFFMVHDGAMYMTFDGSEWECVDSDMARRWMAEND